MALKRSALTNKLIVVGIDGMDPRLTKKYLDEGKMPNTAKILERGSAREDLVLLGGQPTVTPPMWTTLATGAHPYTHGITCFGRQSKKALDLYEYNMDSSLCQAEQIWNVTAEAGYKTLVWHWPCAWPPSSKSENLLVVDGSQPSGVNEGVGIVDAEKILVADVRTEHVDYVPKAASDSKVPCVIDDLKISAQKKKEEDVLDGEAIAMEKESKNIMLKHSDGENAVSDAPFDVALSPIKEASGWQFEIPEGSKEFTLVHSGGLVRRPSLIVKNAEGIYDRVIVYKSKKNAEQLVELVLNVFTSDIHDEAIKNGETYRANRNMRLLQLSPDGTHLKLWISRGTNMDLDIMFHPKRLFQEVVEEAGYPHPLCLVGGADVQLIRDCMAANWERAGQWTADAIHTLIKKENVDVVFSQFHNIDLQSHMIAKYLYKGHNDVTPEEYQKLMENVYIQTDDYIGRYLDLLDDGWTVIVLSDHGVVCPEYEPPLLCDNGGLNAGLMSELGFTVLKKDENGNPIKEIDWSKTKAVQGRGNHIHINVKGRWPHGIIEPEDQYEVEEEIITALYNYKHPVSGHRIVSMALRNRDAILLGMGGPESGDIVLWLAEGYNHDHCDSLSTTIGKANTSVSPIFFGAGPGLKVNHKTERVIREVDVASTIAVLLGVRMPAQNEGSVVHQILTEEF